MTRIVLMGPPGAGKGTQAAKVCAALDIPHISTGQIFRDNVARGTELGLQAAKYMDRGAYVPDSATNAMVRSRLREPDAAEGFLLDGYPRTAAQVKELNKFLDYEGTSLDAAVEITVDTDEVVARLLKRAELESRPDDTEDVIRHRMKVYTEQTEPLTRMYADQGILIRVDGMGTVDEVSQRVLAALRN